MLSAVSTALDFNKATLSGALDVIAVQHDDGTIHCTPFHVRFGKFKLLRSRDRIVRVVVNGLDTGLVMQVGMGHSSKQRLVAELEWGLCLLL